MARSTAQKVIAEKEHDQPTRDFLNLVRRLAVNEVMREQGLDPATDAHWICIDIDWKAVCGAYIQLTLPALQRKSCTAIRSRTKCGPCCRRCRQS